MMDFSSGNLESSALPIVTRVIPPGMGDALAAFCRALETAAQGQPVDDAVISTGLQILLGITALPPTPALPGAPWIAREVVDDEMQESVLQVESAEGDALSLHRDASGVPTVGSWKRIGTEEAALFSLVQGVTGWELEVETSQATFNNPVTVPPGISWTPALAGGGAVAGVVAGVVGAVIAATSMRNAPPAVSPAAATPAPVASTPVPAEPKPDSATTMEVATTMWYYLLHDQQAGPVGEDTLRRLLTEGTLTGDTLVWRDGMTDWETLATALPAVIPVNTAPAPPPPAPPAPQSSPAPAPVAVAGWYYLVDGRQQGPVDEVVLRQALSAGTLTRDTLLWREGMGDWQPLAVVFPALVAQPSAPPSPAPPVAAPPVASVAVPVLSWYYQADGRQQGPVTEEVLRQWLVGGRLTPDTLLWNETLANWQPAAVALPLPSSAPPAAAPAPQPASVATEWYYLVNGQQTGPVSERDLRSWLQGGWVPPETLVWNAALPEWMDARRAGLLAASPAASPAAAATGPAKGFCGSCGAPLPTGAHFCGACGQAQ